MAGPNLCSRIPLKRYPYLFSPQKNLVGLTMASNPPPPNEGEQQQYPPGMFMYICHCNILCVWRCTVCIIMLLGYHKMSFKNWSHLVGEFYWYVDLVWRKLDGIAVIYPVNLSIDGDNLYISLNILIRGDAFYNQLQKTHNHLFFFSTYSSIISMIIYRNDASATRDATTRYDITSGKLYIYCISVLWLSCIINFF